MRALAKSDLDHPVQATVMQALAGRTKIEARNVMREADYCAKLMKNKIDGLVRGNTLELVRRAP